MKKFLFLCKGVVMLGVGLTLSSCELDDYPGPDAGIYGVIVDQNTQQPLPTEQPNGIRLRLWDEKPEYIDNRTPIDTWVKADGTYKNSKVFSGPYEVEVLDGPFYHPVASQKVNVKGMTEINFVVEPFLTIDASISGIAGGIQGTYRLKKSRSTEKITEARLIVSSIPAVSVSVFDVIDGQQKFVTRDLSSESDAIVEATEYSGSVTGLLSGKTYYARVAARTNTTVNGKYNYSPVVAIKIP